MAVKPYKPVTVRSRMVLEVASELVGPRDFPWQQAQVLLRGQGADQWELSLFGSDSPAAIDSVARGETTMGMVNPSSVLTAACRGVHPFRGPAPLRAITVIPSRDEFVLAVNPGVGVETLEEIGERRVPLKVSLRGQRDHSIHLVLDHVLHAAGWSLGDLRAWGGEVHYDADLPASGTRMAQAAAGEVDAIFDEAVDNWLDKALARGMTVLTMSAATVKRLESWGYRTARILKADHPLLDSDITTIDFSGFAVFVREDAPDELVRMICDALHKRADRIQLQTGEPLPLRDMCTDGDGSPLDVPFHPAAESYWASLGYR